MKNEQTSKSYNWENKNGECPHLDIKKFWDKNKNLNESQLNRFGHAIY